MKATNAFFCCNMCNQRTSTNGMPWSNYLQGRSKTDFENPDPNTADVTGIKSRPPLFNNGQFHPAVTVPFEPMHGIPAGILKAEDQKFLLQNCAKTTSNQKGPIAQGPLFDWVCKVQDAFPVPNTMLRIRSARAATYYKAKDYLTFFLTVMAFALKKLTLASKPIRDRDKYVAMIAALHLFTLLYLSYNATEYVDYIHFAAHAYVRHAISWHGALYTSYNWHMLSHASGDTRRHGPAMLRSAFGSELYFKRFRTFINCYHQQATSLINKRFYLLNVDPVHATLRQGRNKPETVLHARHKIEHTQLSQNVVAAVTERAGTLHPRGAVTFYSAVNHYGFDIGINSDRKLNRKVFTDAVVSHAGNWFETHLVVNVRTELGNQQYLWCKKFIPQERLGNDNQLQPWSIGPIPAGIPPEVVRKFYCRGKKSTYFGLLPLSSVYCTAYTLPQQTRDTKEPVTLLIAIPIKGVQ